MLAVAIRPARNELRKHGLSFPPIAHLDLPSVVPHYAGYVAWRGSLPEADAPDHLAAFFDDRFSFSDARSGGHILVYLIPGPNADTTAGKRLLNWVWYIHVSEAKLPEVLTDKDGRRHHSSLPQGGATEAAVTALRDHARREIHPLMAELVASTPDPFIQAIVDVVVPRTVFGRACLLGDAAFVVRPHTAGATAKAASDSMFLAEALVRAQGSVPEALRAFESVQIDYGIQMYRYGVALGDRWARPASRVYQKLKSATMSGRTASHNSARPDRRSSSGRGNCAE